MDTVIVGHETEADIHCMMCVEGAVWLKQHMMHQWSIVFYHPNLKHGFWRG